MLSKQKCFFYKNSGFIKFSDALKKEGFFGIRHSSIDPKWTTISQLGDADVAELFPVPDPNDLGSDRTHSSSSDLSGDFYENGITYCESLNLQGKVKKLFKTWKSADNIFFAMISKSVSNSCKPDTKIGKLKTIVLQEVHKKDIKNDDPTDDDASNEDDSEKEEEEKGIENVKSWNNEKVIEWLVQKDPKFPQYEEKFKLHKVTGQNLLEVDILKLVEWLGIDFGDRINLLQKIDNLKKGG